MPGEMRIYKFVIPTVDSVQQPGRLAIVVAGSEEDARGLAARYCASVEGDPSWLAEATVRTFSVAAPMGVAWVEVG